RCVSARAQRRPVDRPHARRRHARQHSRHRHQRGRTARPRNVSGRGCRSVPRQTHRAARLVRDAQPLDPVGCPMNDSERKAILLVDDSPLTLAVTREALEDAGYTVLCARDLEEMEKHRGSHKPDLILMDVQMPEAFGDDVAMVLRGAKGIRTPIYLLSTLD